MRGLLSQHPAQKKGCSRSKMRSSQTFRMSGRELALTGLPIALDSALTSELVMYERKERR